MTGAQESSVHCEVHSCLLEQIPEHQPQLMKRGAIKHMEHVIKCAHPGPAEGTLNIWIRREEDDKIMTILRPTWVDPICVCLFILMPDENTAVPQWWPVCTYILPVSSSNCSRCCKNVPYFQLQREDSHPSTQLRSWTLLSLPEKSWQKQSACTQKESPTPE